MLPISISWRVSSKSFSVVFIISKLTLKYLIHCVLIFVHGERWRSTFIFLHMVVQFCQHGCLRECSFSNTHSWCLHGKSIASKGTDFLLELCCVPLVYVSMCLAQDLQEEAHLIVLRLYCVLKSIMMVPQFCSLGSKLICLFEISCGAMWILRLFSLICWIIPLAFW